MIRTILWTAAIIAVCLGCHPFEAAALSGTGAFNMTYNTSVRFGAMGGAGVGAPWGQDTNHWANPAALAHRRGLHYLDFKSNIAEWMTDDIVLTNREITYGAGGFAFLLAVGPGLGNTLDLGTQMIVDEDNNLVGSQDSYMETTSWGLAVDPVAIWARKRGSQDSDWARRYSLAFGLFRQHFSEHLGADQTIQDGIGGEANEEASLISAGVQLRATPIEIGRIDGVGDNGVVAFRLGAAYGRSVLARTDEFLEREIQTDDVLPRAHVAGWSIHADMPLAESVKREARSELGQLIVAGFDPLFSITYCSQRTEPGFLWVDDHYVYERDTSGTRDETGHGWEVGLANIFTLRRGHFKSQYIDGDTKGWGVNLQLGSLGGFRYDWAAVPLASGFPDEERSSWAVWIDPAALRARRAQ